MKKIRNILLLIIILVAVLGLPAAAYAKPLNLPHFDDKVIFAGTFKLEEGEVLNGSLVAFGGVATLEKGSVVNGDVVVFGGNVTVSGDIQQSLVAIGGVVSLKETAIVHGDLVAPGTALHREDGSSVRGQVITESGAINFDIPDIPEIPEIPEVPEVPEVPELPALPPLDFNGTNQGPTFVETIGRTFSPITQVLWFMFRLFAFSAVAVLMMLFVPDHVGRTGKTILSQPVLSGSMGLLTLVLCIPVVVVLAITIILSPASFLVVILISLGLFFGWIAIGVEVGKRIGEGLGQEWTPAVQAGVGAFALAFMIGALSFILWEGVGWMIGVALGAVGLGAVVLTRFGTRDYVSGTKSEQQVAQED